MSQAPTTNPPESLMEPLLGVPVKGKGGVKRKREKANAELQSSVDESNGQGSAIGAIPKPPKPAHRVGSKEKTKKSGLTSKGKAESSPTLKKPEKRLLAGYQDNTWVYIGYPPAKEESVGDLAKILQKLNELIRSKDLSAEVETVTKDAPGAVKVKLRSKDQAYLLEGLSLKLDKETSSTIHLYKGGANKVFKLSRFGPASNKQVWDAVKSIFGREFNIYFREISGVKLGEALVRLKMVPKNIPKMLPVLDWNATVTIPSTSTRGKCPLCNHAEHSEGCVDTVKYDPKMGVGERAKVEAMKERRNLRRKERAVKVGPLTNPSTDENHTDLQSPPLLEETTQREEEVEETRTPVYQQRCGDGCPPSSGNTVTRGSIHSCAGITSPSSAGSSLPHTCISPLGDGGEGEDTKEEEAEGVGCINGSGGIGKFDPSNPYTRNETNKKQIFRGGDLVRLGCCNVDCLSEEKCFSLFSFVIREQFDIFVLLDIRNPGPLSKLEHRGVEFYVNCPTNNAGIAILLRNPLGKNTISSVFEDAQGRVLICDILCKGRSLRIAGVYLPSRPCHRRSFFSQTDIRVNPNKPCDFVLGDFNLTLGPLDREIPRPTLNDDIRGFQNFLSSLSDLETALVDGYRLEYPNSKEYSHQNRAIAEGSTGGKTRIDRIYVREDLLDRCGDWGLRRSPIPKADHKIAHVVIRHTETHKETRWRMRLSLLNDSTFLKKVFVLFSKGKTFEDWLKAKEQVAKYAGMRYRALTRPPAKRKKRILFHMRHLLRHEPDNPNLVGRLEAELAFLEEVEEAEHNSNALAKFHLLGESPTKAFFAKGRSLAKGSAISALAYKGTVTQSAEHMGEAVKDFYDDLFSPKESDHASVNLLLDDLEFSKKGARKLARPISAKEVEDVLKKAESGKVPGLDGIPVELYKRLKKLTETRNKKKKEKGKPNIFCFFLAKVMNKIRVLDTLPQSFTQGALSLLWKDGSPSRTDLKYYRPLTVLNADYKLYTSILQRRLTRYINREGRIGVWQSAFLPERLIDDNIKTVQYTIELCDRRAQSLSIAFLDQEKAYDRVSRDWLWKVLAKMNVPETFITQVKALYEGAYVIPYVNGIAGPKIYPKSGVRQGDGLSCPLYITSIEPLARRINGDYDIRGIPITETIFLKLVLFADDLVIFAGSISDGMKLLEHLRVYEAASGARINARKSVAYTANGGIKIPIENMVEQDCIKHLGVYVGRDIKEKCNILWAKIRSKAEATVDNWTKYHLSLKGRKIVANSLIASLPRYHLRVLDPPMSFVNAMDSLY